MRSPGGEQGTSDGLPLPRWVLYVALPGAVAPLLIFAFIVVTQRAHDESRCAYRELERRAVPPDAFVIEEGRSCIAGIEERRYSLLRSSGRSVLGERRFELAAFAPDHYRFSATQTPQGEVQVVVHNDGHDDVLFREGTAEERAKGISRGHVRAPQSPP